ncbi:MAG TPA: TadE family protein [Planktothrix sp.]|jgi:hypothetical protein
MNLRQRRQRIRGGAIVEASGAVALLVPLFMILLLSIAEISQYFVLKQQIAYVARQAAQELAYGYGVMGYTSMNSAGMSSGVANTRDSNYLNIINNIAVPGVINESSNPQFKASFYIPNSPSMSQSYVQVTVSYKSGPNLPSFPWNPLNSTFASFSMVGLTVGSACSWPIPHN